ncbi:hypothetical protein OAU50_05975 [Planctomycetota bacterium]|nr:hypothetical protein [Planctomycetota bacterium]
MKKLALVLPLLLLAVAGCEGDFDQRVDDAPVYFTGQGSLGSTINPILDVRVAGVVSIAGVVAQANVTLRPINLDGTVDWDDNNALGQGISDNNGIYTVYVSDTSYRGPILVEVSGKQTGSVITEGANPATADSNPHHHMTASHKLFSVLPYFDAVTVEDVHVSVFTTLAVARALSFDGSVASVTGGISSGLFGMSCQQVAEFFGITRVRKQITRDFANSGLAFTFNELNGWANTALSQVAKDSGVTNVFDFYLGAYNDMLDDGELNASIVTVPNTGIPMPNLSSASLIGNALLNNFMDPLNTERVTGGDNTTIATGGDLDALITTLNTTRDINTVVRAFDLILRVQTLVQLNVGDEVRASIIAVDQIGSSQDVHVYGDSGGPGFVDFVWTSSSPADVSVNAFGRIVVAPTAAFGTYTLQLAISPKAGQTFVTGSTFNETITVVVQ